MSTQSLYRLGGFASILSGLLLGLSIIIRFATPANGLTAQSISFVALLITVFSLTALYVAQANKGGRLSFAGYLLAVIGIILTEVVSFLWIATYDGLSEAHSLVMFAWGTFPILHIAVLGSFFGFLMFGVATMRAGVYPRWTGIIMAIGVTVYTFAEYIPMLYTLALPGVLALSLSFTWMGLTLISSTSKQPANFPVAHASSL